MNSSVSLFAGSWSYRSFRSNPDLSVPVDELLFGMGELELAVSSAGQITGTLGGVGWQLNLTGTATATNPATIRFQGRGTIAGEEWVYDYLGYHVPTWENGVDQRPAIVGTIVRTKAHSGGNATAGFVAQWIAVRRDTESSVDDQPKALESPHTTPKQIRSPAERNRNLLKMYWDEYGDETDTKRVRGLLNFNGQPEIESGARTETIRSVNGRLDVTLRVRYADLQIGSDPVRLRVYNDNLVGPVLRAKAGDTLHITLVNELPVEPSTPHGNGHHSWNTTNLHFHGLHVSPEGVAGAQQDNIFASLEPLPSVDPNYPATEKYEVKIPDNHVAGTFWYHAHRHGSVAGQVAGGLAGALIIERDIEDGQIDRLNLDSIQEIRDAGEEVIVLQQIPYIWSESSGFGTVEIENADLMLGPGAWAGNPANPGLRRYVTVNGEKIPTIQMSPGEIRRLRFVHTGQREPVNLCVRPLSQPNGDDGLLTMYEIAVDGLPTGRRAARQHLELHPGYRSDVLLEVPQTASGVYYLMDDNAPAGLGERGSMEPLKWVMKIEVSGTPVSGKLPSVESLAQIGMEALPLDQVSPVPQLAFYGIHIPREGSGESLRFLISRRDLSRSLDAVSPSDPEDRDYNSSNPPRFVQLNTIDRWLVGSRNGTATGGKPGITHPFHIHTNPFQIVRISDVAGNDLTEQELGEGYTYLWRDSLAMKQGLTYELLTKYEDFTGSFVNHCHILDHEDNGMMEKVTIIDPTNPSPVTPLTSDAAGGPSQKTILTEIPEPAGTPQALFFVRGSFCPHCLEQVTEMATKLPQSRCHISVVSASTVDDLKQFPDLPYGLIADPEGELFKRFNLGDDTHGTILLNGAGEEIFRRTGSEPFMEVSTVASVLNESTPTVAIDVRGTPEVTDDYITWAPTLCQARVVGGDPAGPDIRVVLSNDDPGSIPTGGDVRFASTVATGETATNETLELSLPQDGTGVSFYIAGAFRKPSTLTPESLELGGRDAVIEVRDEGDRNQLLGSHAVMVRVRKAMRRSDSREPKLNDLELFEFLKALRALHFDHNRYEYYVEMHRLATGQGSLPDQAHKGPAFVAWHRAFLLEVERELQGISPHVALPYWVQDEPQDFFSRHRYGINDGSRDTCVIFDKYSPSAGTGSPLYGWSISLAPDPPNGNSRMGLLLRQNSDHNNQDSSYEGWGSRLMRFSSFRDAMPNYWSQRPDGIGLGDNENNFNVERNPHNNGHGLVGPDGRWMENCRESNADPVFWVFHCNHDHLWAKWQHYHNRFMTARGNPDHYWPSDAFPGLDRAIPRGHHLLDPMWPWDGSSSIEFPGERPNRRYPPFPSSPLPGLWPEEPAHPRPADVIDYLGITDHGNELGFCYDDVEWGHDRRSSSGPDAEPLIASDVRGESALFFSKGLSPDTRMLAFQDEQRQDGRLEVRSLTDLILSPDENIDVRLKGLKMLSGRKASEGLIVSRRMLIDEEAPLAVRLESLKTIGALLHFTPLSHAQHLEIRREMSGVLSEDDTPTALQRELLHALAPTGEQVAEKLLVSSLRTPSTSALSVPETIRLLAHFPNQYSLVREKLASPNDETVIAAIDVLNHDIDSVEQRIGVARNTERSQQVRLAAIQSLIHDHDAKAVDALLSVFASPEAELSIRAEAIAAARVNLELSEGFATRDQLQAWTNIVRDVPTSDEVVTELTALKGDFLVQITNGENDE
jgi:FtsP/CotA-like multicopper oxidase with cupredoxin domain